MMNLKLPCLLIALAGLAACASSAPPQHTTAPSTGKIMQDSSQQLGAYQWQLKAATNANQQAQPGWLQTGSGPVTLRFQNNQVLISGLCNNMMAQYRLQGQQMAISQVAGTMKMCANETLMRYERQFALRLPQVETWQIEASQPLALVLTFQDGAQWILEGSPTQETIYGGPGETVFLEVAAQKVACQHPLIPNHQCLLVREITYDDSGIKKQVGEWTPFYDNIENYTHEAGVRNVLRLKRYTRQQAPADASRYVYILDMVVETELAQPSNSR